MNKILNIVLTERNGNYCHAIEVESVYELECVIEMVIESYSYLWERWEGYEDYDQYGDYGNYNDYVRYWESQVIDFFETMELYCLDDNNENEIYSFNFRDYIQGTL